MNAARQPKLSCAEIAALWTQYMNDSAGLLVNRVMLRHIECDDTKAAYRYAADMGAAHLETIRSFLKQEHYPIPIGFTEEDVDYEAPRLFSDVFCQHYLNIMSLHGCHGYSGAVTTSSREDVRQYFSACSASAVELCNRTKDVMLNHGTYFRPPALVPPERVDFVRRESFLSGWFRETRPLSCIEITDILFNLKKSILAKALIVAFGQTAVDEAVRAFFSEAAEVKDKHIRLFTETLETDELPVPPNLVSEVSNSTTPPFSDKLMMFLIGFLFSSAMVYYGSGLASSPRKDLAPKYMMAIADDLRIGGEWMTLMIDRGWLEQPPLAQDRKALTSVKR